VAGGQDGLPADGHPSKY